MERATADLAERLRTLVENVGPVVLELDEEADNLAEAFLANEALPASKVEDAQHVAVAVVNELDVLASWNYRHLVNVRRSEALRQVSVTNGYYKPLHIVSPPEVTDEIQ